MKCHSANQSSCYTAMQWRKYITCWCKENLSVFTFLFTQRFEKNCTVLIKLQGYNADTTPPEVFSFQCYKY